MCLSLTAEQRQRDWSESCMEIIVFAGIKVPLHATVLGTCVTCPNVNRTLYDRAQLLKFFNFKS